VRGVLGKLAATGQILRIQGGQLAPAAGHQRFPKTQVFNSNLFSAPMRLDLRSNLFLRGFELQAKRDSNCDRWLATCLRGISCRGWRSGFSTARSTSATPRTPSTPQNRKNRAILADFFYLFY